MLLMEVGLVTLVFQHVASSGCRCYISRNIARRKIPLGTDDPKDRRKPMTELW